MLKHRICATATGLPRRSFLAGAIVAPLATVPVGGAARGHSAVADVISELEGWQDWESRAVTATKGYAAYRLRSALGMDMPDPEYAQLHLDSQRRAYEDWVRTVWFDESRAEGIVMTPPPMVLV